MIEVRAGELLGLLERWRALGKENDEKEEQGRGKTKGVKQTEKYYRRGDKGGRTEGPVVFYDGEDVWWREVTHWDPDGNMIKFYEDMEKVEEAERKANEG